MTSTEHVANKVEEYQQNTLARELTLRRRRALKTDLSITKLWIETNASCMDDQTGQTTLSLTKTEMEDVGRMAYLLDQFFPDGEVPADFRQYQEFVKRQQHTYGATLDEVIERELKSDHEVLERAKRKMADLDDKESFTYAWNLVNVVESEEVRPDQTRLIVRYGHEDLYEENIPEGAFPGLKQGTTLIFDYTTQGLTPNLLESFRSNKSRVKGIEEALVEGTTNHAGTKIYLGNVFETINRSIQRE